MKKLILIILAVLMLSGCGLSNEEIAKEIKFCSDAGLGVIITWLPTGEINSIQCNSLTNE